MAWRAMAFRTCSSVRQSSLPNLCIANDLSAVYGAQGPTAFSNGPSCVECQGDWIIDALAKARKENVTYLNATRKSEEDWNKYVEELSDKTLFPVTDSWYMGANVPGKKREQ